eukprot:1162003-Pelagomonas_calceolata.AAC.11
MEAPAGGESGAEVILRSAGVRRDAGAEGCAAEAMESMIALFFFTYARRSLNLILKTDDDLLLAGLQTLCGAWDAG